MTKTIIIHPYSRPLRNGKPNPKNYPYWPELVEMLGPYVGVNGEQDHLLIQVGVEGEHQLVPDFRKGLRFTELCALLREADTFVSVDSFLPHMAALVKRPGFVIFGPSDPLIFGHDIHTNILKDRKYLRPNQFDWWEQAEYRDEAFPSAEEVHKIIRKKLYQGDR